MINFLMRLFGYKDKVECPFCRNNVEIDARKCGSCHSDVPRIYSENFKRAAPVSVPLVGGSNHGKTVFLFGLVHTLSELSHPKIWDKFNTRPANPFTENLTIEINKAKAENRKPFPTNPGERERDWRMEPTEAGIMLLNSMPLWGSRTLVLRDVGGELYEEFVFHESQREFCQKSPCAIMVLDPTDLTRSPEFAMNTMLNRYINSLEESGIKVEKEARKIVIVISKADALRDSLPPHLTEYVESDPIRDIVDKGGANTTLTLNNPASMHEYVRGGLVTLDEHLRNWVCTLRGGNELIALANQYGIQLRFTLTSAWGDDPDQITRMQPKRVIDPFLWLLEFYSEDKS